MLARSAPRPASRLAAASIARSRVAPVATRSIFTVIQQGFEGWRLSMGQSPTKLEPGLRLNIPLYHSIQQVDMRERSVNISELSGFTSDNVPVTISGSLFYKVNNSYHACFSVEDYAQNVAFIGTSAMRSVIGRFNYDEVIADRNAINLKLHDVIGETIEKWGVRCTRFEIQKFQPSNRDVEKQLELQMAAERERRKKILDTKAMVNVAEGHKQRVILESEAAFQSQLNTASGEKQKMILESEGFLAAAKNEGEALADQVEVLARSLAHPSEPTPADKKAALQALLELRRLEQLKAIASSEGNSTYFFGDAKGAGRDGYETDNMEKWKRTLRDGESSRHKSAPLVVSGGHANSESVVDPAVLH
ncbi:stomatin family protein [Trametopsis cervina]|nr:stomatin family protein [Trametopsis cervina]